MEASSTSSNYPHEQSVNTSTGLKTFIITSELGTGAYNNAYLAYDKARPEDQFVLKTYISGKESNNREAQILALMRSHSVDVPIVRLLEPSISIGDSKGHVEALAKGTKIHNQLPSTRQALELAIRFAQLLKLCAESGVAYRDIKPSDHVFWESDNKLDAVKSMTVIDWNIAQYQAPFDALYFDLTKFCRCLPEFFMGKPPQAGEYYHPLEWHFSDEMQARISPKLWLILANLSMNFVVPVIPDGEALLAITSISKQSIIDAWSGIIKQLSVALECLDTTEIPDLGVKGLDKEIRAYLVEWFKAPDIVTTSLAHELIYAWTGVNGILNPLRVVKQTDSDELARLRISRLLNPGGFRETVLFSIFVAIYRTGLIKDDIALKILRRILQGLLDQKPPDLIYRQDDFETLSSLARGKAHTFKYTDIEKIHGEIWDSLAKEFQIWISCTKFEKESDAQIKHRFAEEMDRSHPVCSFLLREWNNHNRVRNLKNDIDNALEGSNFELATILAKSLSNTNPQAEAEYLSTINICRELKKIRGEENTSVTEIEQLLQKIGNKPLPASYLVQANTLKQYLSMLSIASSLVEGSEDNVGLESLQMISRWIKEVNSTDSSMDVVIEKLKNNCRDKLRKHKERVVIRESSGLEMLTGVPRVEKLRLLSSLLGQMQDIWREWGEKDLEQECKKQKQEYDFEIGDFERQARKDLDTYKEDHYKSLRSAGESVDELRVILNRLQYARKEFPDDDFKNWLSTEVENVQALIGAAELLSTLQDNQKRELELDITINRLSSYPEAQALENKLLKFRDENVYRHQVLKSIDELSQAQKKTSTSLEDLNRQGKRSSRIDENDIKPSPNQDSITTEDLKSLSDKLIEVIDETFLALNRSNKALERKLKQLLWAMIIGVIGIFCTLAFLSIMFSSSYRLPVISNTSTATLVISTPTPQVATATQEVVLPTQNVEPTIAVSLPPTATPDAAVTTGEQWLLKTNAMFLASDFETKLWSFTNPSNLTNMKVEVLDTKDTYSLVKIQIVVSNSVINNNTIQSPVTIRTFESWDGNDKPPVIGNCIGLISLELAGDAVNGQWQAAFIQGWVDNTFLEALKAQD